MYRTDFKLPPKRNSRFKVVQTLRKLYLAPLKNLFDGLIPGNDIIF